LVIIFHLSTVFVLVEVMTESQHL